MEATAAGFWALPAGCAAISAFLTIKATICPFFPTLRTAGSFFFS